MARVPTVQPQFVDVSTQPLANVTQNASATPENMGAAEGRAIAGFGQAVTNVANQFDAVVEKKRLEQDERDAQNALTQLRSYRRTALWGDDENAGYLALQGEDAVKQAADTDAALIAQRDQIAADLGLNERAKLLYSRASNDLLSRTSDTIVGHSSRQRAVANAQVAEAEMKEALDLATAALHDPAAQDEAFDQVVNAFHRMAERNGLPAEARKSGMEAAITKYFTARITGHLSEDDPATARAVFNANKKLIDGSAHAGIERSIRASIEKQETTHRDEVAGAVAVLSAGKDYAGLDELRAKVGPKFQQKLDEAAADKDAVSEFTHKTLPEQQAELRGYVAKVSSDPVEVRQMARKAEVNRQMTTQISQGYGLHVAAGLGYVEQPSELNFNQPETLVQRRQQAEIASKKLGVPVSPFTPHDVTELVNQLDKANASTAAGILGNISSTFGHEQAVSIAGAMTKGERPEFAAAILRAQDNPKVATGIVMGGRLRREQGQNLQITPEQRRSAIENVYGSMFEGTDAEPLGEFVEAANALYATRRIPTGDLSYDDKEYERALRDVAGGIVQYQGRPTIPPRPEYDADDMEDIIGQLTDADLTARSVSGGAPMTASGQRFGSDLFSGTGFFGRNKAQLISVAPGVYRVWIPGGGMVMDGARAGRPYELDLRGMKPKTGYRAITDSTPTQVP